MRTKGGRKKGFRKSERCGDGGLGTPPTHLAIRIRAFEAMSGGRNFDERAFHKPGSNKK